MFAMNQHKSQIRQNLPSKSGLLLVVQKRQGRNLRYDFRLEVDGALKPWAVIAKMREARMTSRGAVKEGG